MCFYLKFYLGRLCKEEIRYMVTQPEHLLRFLKQKFPFRFAILYSKHQA